MPGFHFIRAGRGIAEDYVKLNYDKRVDVWLIGTCMPSLRPHHKMFKSRFLDVVSDVFWCL